MQQFGSQQSADRPILKRLSLVETGTYDDQYFKPYQLIPSQQDLVEFQELAYGNTRVSSVGMAGLAGRMLEPRAQASGAVGIANGWGTRRCRFLMEIQFPTGLGNYITEYVTGHTDYVGASMMGRRATLDGGMLFSVNNTVSVRNTMNRSGGTGTFMSSTILDSSHVISPVMRDSSSMLTGLSNPVVSLLRPQDIIGPMQTMSLPGDTTDTRNMMIGLSVKKSRRSNGLPTEYLARAINAVAASEELQTLQVEGAQNSDVYSGTRARDELREPLATRDYFLRMLNTQTSFKYERSFTFKELCGLFPNADDIFTFSPRGQLVQKDFFEAVRGGTQSMADCGPVTMVATKLSTALPAIMIDLLLSEINFEVTNETMGDRPYIKINGHQSFADVDTSPYVHAFMERLEREIIPDITNNGNMSIKAFIYVDVLGDTNMKISFAGSPITPYCIPSFSDALFNPIISDDASLASAISHDISNMANMLGTTSNKAQFNTPFTHSGNQQQNTGHSGNVNPANANNVLSRLSI